MQILVALSFISTLAFATLASSQEAPAEDLESPRRPPRLQQRVSSSLRGLTDRIDHLLGTERDDENKRTSTLRVWSELRAREGDPLTQNIGARLTLKFATLQAWERSLEKWWRERITRNQSTEESDTHSDQAQKEDPVASPWEFSLVSHVHPRWDCCSRFGTRARLSRDFEDPLFFHHLTGDLLWSNENQWENVVTLISNMELQPHLLLQFLNLFDWQISAKTLRTEHGPRLTYELSSTQAVSLHLTAQLQRDEDSWMASAYRLSASYRQSLYEDWILISLQPFVDFSRDLDYQARHGVQLNLEAVF